MRFWNCFLTTLPYLLPHSLPPSLFISLVSLPTLTFFSCVSALMQLPRAERDRLMFLASSRVSPSAPVLPTLSLPAEGWNWNFKLTSHFSSPLFSYDRTTFYPILSLSIHRLSLLLLLPHTRQVREVQSPDLFRSVGHLWRCWARPHKMKVHLKRNRPKNEYKAGKKKIIKNERRQSKWYIWNTWANNEKNWRWKMDERLSACRLRDYDYK